jgi:hypothetical protein
MSVVQLIVAPDAVMLLTVTPEIVGDEELPIVEVKVNVLDA